MNKCASSDRYRTVLLVLLVPVILIMASALLAQSAGDVLTAEEREWLTRNPVICIAPERNYAPFIFTDVNGESKGISVDYLNLLEKKLRIKFCMLNDDNLAILLEKVREKEADIVTSLTKTPERSSYLIFTHPYISVPAVIITKKSVTGTFTLSRMETLRIAVGRGYGVESYLRRNYPLIRLVPANDDVDCLKMLSFGEVDAAVVDLASASHIIETYKIANLRIAGDTGFVYDLSLASRNDRPILNNILNKGLAAISASERKEIYDRWIHIDWPLPFMTRATLTIFAFLLATILLMVLGIIIWNRFLARKVKEKTDDLEKELIKRRMIEEVLRESEEKFTKLFQNAPALISVTDVETGRYVDVNEEALRVSGFKREEVIGHTLAEVGWLAEGQRTELLNLVQTDAMNSGMEMTFTAKDGRLIVGFVKGDIISISGNNFLLTATVDITKRKLMEETLKESEKRYRTLVENAGEGILIVQDGNFAYANPKTGRILRVKPEDLIGKPFLDYIHPEDKDVVLDRYKRRLDGETITNAIEFRIINRDGESRLLYSSAQKVQWNENPAILNLVLDITEQRRAEEQLRKSHELERLILSSVPHGIFGLENRQIIFANDAIKNAFGWKPEELIGKNTRIFFRSDLEWQEFGATVYDLLEKENIFSFEPPKPFIRKDGREIYCRVSFSKIAQHSNQSNKVVVTIEDITERKSMEDKLKESVQRYELVLSGAVGAIWDWDIPGRKVLFSSRWKSMRGYEETEIGDSEAEWRDRIHPEDISRVMKALQMHFDGETPIFQEEYRTRCKDGSYTWILDRGKVIRDTSGQVFRMAGSEIDITERKKAEREIYEVRAKLGSLVEQAVEGFWVLDRDFRTTYVNPAMEQMLGYASEEMTGQSWYAFGDPEWNARALELENRCSKGVVEPHNFMFIHKSGRKVLTRVSTTPLYDFDENFDGALGILTDITRQEETEDALRVKDMLNAVAQSAGLGICIIQLDFTIAWYNDMYANWFGNLSSKSGRNCFEVFEGRKEVCPDCPVNVTLETGSSVTVERINPTMADRVFSVSTAPIRNSDDKIIQVIEVTHDITDIRRVEKQLTAANEELSKAMIRTEDLRRQAESANRAKSLFLANMSHEIRTPMSGVLGMTELLLQTPLTDHQHRYAEMIKISGEALVAVINDILDFSRIEAGRLQVESFPFSLEKDVINRTLALFQNQAEKKGLLLRSSFFSSIPPVLVGDAQRLSQVVTNLLGNAVKFTEEGEIEISVGVLDQTEQRVFVRISVRDTGIGMEEASQKLIFDSFSQAETTTARRYGGSGLGLSISKHLVELMGGEIKVKSIPGKGSDFTVLLPLAVTADAGVAPLTPSKASPLWYEGVRALVVEDHEINQEILQNLLERAGIESDVARNGREAVELVRTGNYDILFMDIQMPEMDGFAATKEIRALGKKGVGSLPIVALTAHALTGDREKSLSAGMNDHLTKPIALDALREALARWLPREKQKEAPPTESRATRCDIGQADVQQHVLDTSRGLRFAEGNHVLYFKHLNDFLERYRDSADRLMTELSAERTEEATRRVHSIKGIAGYLGGKQLESAAAALEKVLRSSQRRHSDPIPQEPLDTFINCHKELFDAISKFVHSNEPASRQPTEVPEGSAEEAIALLKQLREGLANSEPKPCKEIMDRLRQKSWQGISSREIEELNRLVKRYHFPEALEFIDKLFMDVKNKEKILYE